MAEEPLSFHNGFCCVELVRCDWFVMFQGKCCVIWCSLLQLVSWLVCAVMYLIW